MKHVYLCDAAGEEDTLVDSALESDCEACRNKANVGMFSKKPDPRDPYAIREAPLYVEEPYPNADEILAEKRRRTE